MREDCVFLTSTLMKREIDARDLPVLITAGGTGAGRMVAERFPKNRRGAGQTGIVRDASNPENAESCVRGCLGFVQQV
jgi:hypothetical protein